MYWSEGVGSVSGAGTVFELPAAATPIATASFLDSDTKTEGNWINVYGTVGYNVINTGSSYPSNVTVTPSNELAYTWTTNTTVAGVLEDAPGTGSGRIAAAWYSSTSFTVDVDFTDTQNHDIELYLLDWNDANQRTETIALSNAATGSVLSTQTVSDFTNGVVLELGSIRKHPDYHHTRGRRQRDRERPVYRPRSGISLLRHNRNLPRYRLDDARELDQRLRQCRLQRDQQRLKLPVERHGHAIERVVVHLDDEHGGCRASRMRRVRAAAASPPPGTHPHHSPSMWISPIPRTMTSSCTCSTGTTRTSGPRRSP